MSTPVCNKSDYSNLTCYYQNVRGLRTKTQDIFVSSVAATEYDLVAFTESWLNDTINSSELFDLMRFEVFRSDRNYTAMNKHRGGGVLLAVNSTLKPCQIDICSMCNTFKALIFLDILCVRINFLGNTLYIIVLYIPPHTSCENYDIIFDAIESLHCIIGANILIIGDFNIPDHSANPGHPLSKSLNNFAQFLNLEQKNNILNQNNRTLDLVYSNYGSCYVSRADDIFVIEDAHHPALIIKSKFPKTYKETFPLGSRHDLNYKKGNFNLLYNDIMFIDWSVLSNFANVNDMLTEFYNILNPLLDKHVPRKKATSKQYPPWFDKNIINKVNLKGKLLSEYKKSNNEEVYNNFKNVRSEVKSLIKIAYKNYLKSIEDELCNNPKKFWSHINSKSNSTTVPSCMNYNNTQLNEPTEIVNAFASYFSDVFLNAKNKSNAPDSQHLVNQNSNTLYISEISENEIINAIKKIKGNFTMGPDLIPAFLIRDCAMIFAKPLHIIFNFIITSGEFPQLWKESRICPIYKKGSRNEISNYRPISIICNFCKIFEIIIHSHLYFHARNLISPHQHGFMSGRSTTSNLVEITQYVSEVLDEGNQVDVIYTDFSKAFDRLDHELLLSKLDTFGVSVNLLNLFRSYLNDRAQFVQYRGFKSEKFLQLSGVPQGSILGPLLFVIFINDITQLFNVNYLLYADDLKIYIEIKSISDCSKLQDNLVKLNDWCVKNLLPLNIGKCNIMSYSRRKTTELFDYHLDNVIMNRVTQFKDLGVTFDSKLSFDEHIRLTTESAYKSLGFVLRNGREFDNVKTLNTLYTAFVRCKLEYASVVWSPSYITYTTQLEKVQRRYLKSLHFVADGIYPPRGIPQDTLLTRFELSSLYQRRIMHSIILLHKIINNTVNSESIISRILYHVPRANLRSNSAFHLPTARTNLLTASPFYQMIQNYHMYEERLDIFACSIHSIKALFA